MGIKVKINNRVARPVSVIGVSQVLYGANASVGGVTKLSELEDVDTSGMKNNDVLVYEESTDKFKIKTLPNVDGGTF